MIKGKVIAINRSEKKGVMKRPSAKACLLKIWTGGDAHGGDWHRQVSLLGQESIDKMVALGAGELTPGNFARTSPPRALPSTSCQWAPG